MITSMWVRTTLIGLVVLAGACSSSGNPDGGVDSGPGPVDIRPPATDAIVAVVDAHPVDGHVPPSPDANLSAPDTTLTAQPPALGNNATVMFAFSSTITPATFACSLDGAPFAACTSPDTITVTDGNHTFAVRATANGETDATPATATFTTDTTPPITTITAATFQEIVGSTNASFSFQANEPATFQCKLDAAAYATCTSPVSYSGLVAGPHVFTVRATDLAGNVEVNPPAHDWTIDLTLPDTMLLHTPDTTSTSSTADFSFVSVPDGATFECRLDSTADTDFHACTSPIEYTGLADGQHTFDVRALGPAGPDPTPAHFGWLIDTTGPRAAISAGVADPTAACPSLTFTYTTEPAEADATFVCALVAGPGPAGTADYAPCPASGQSYTGLVDGKQYTFSVVAVDPLGNHGAPASQTFTVDGQGPTIAITSPAAGQSGPSITVAFTSTVETGDTFTCAVSSGGSTQTIASCASGQAFAGLAAGMHTVTVSGTDHCGNVGSSQVTIDVVIPTTVEIESPAEGSSTCTIGTITYVVGSAKVSDVYPRQYFCRL